MTKKRRMRERVFDTLGLFGRDAFTKLRCSFPWNNTSLQAHELQDPDHSTAEIRGNMSDSEDSDHQSQLDGDETPQDTSQAYTLTRAQFNAIKNITEKVYRLRTKE